MKKEIVKIEDTVEAWEDGSLGRDEAFVKVSTGVNENAINESVGLQLISIRLQKSLIEDLKLIAELNGIGYQPLIRQILKRFANSEKKIILREFAHQMSATAKEEENHPQEVLKKKAVG